MHRLYGTLIARLWVTVFAITFLWRSSQFLGWSAAAPCPPGTKPAIPSGTPW